MIPIGGGRALTLVAMVMGAGLTLAGAPRPCFGSGDHGPAERAVVVSPRAEIRIGTQELVLVYRDRKMTAFLQRYVDGVPTAGADIEVTADFIPATLEEIAPGIYRGDDLILAGGRNEIEVAVTIGDTTETATLPLVIQSTAQLTRQAAALTAVPARTIPAAALAAAAIATYVVVSLLFWMRGRRARRQAV